MTYFGGDFLDISLHYSIMHHFVRLKDFFDGFFQLTNYNSLRIFLNKHSQT